MKNSNLTKKRLVLSVGLTTAALISAAPAKAASFNLNFDEGADGGSVLYNSNGSLQLDQWQDWGVTLSGYNNRTQRVAELNTYNTDSRNGQDEDLETGVAEYGTVSQGNVLIIQEEESQNKSGGQWIEDDERGGGTINFGFDSAVSLTSFSMLDIDDNGQGIKVTGKGTDGNNLIIDIDALVNNHYSVHGNTQGSIFSSGGVTITQLSNTRQNNSMYQFDLDQNIFASHRFTDIEFTYPGSGAISGIQWKTDDAEDIPEPSIFGGLLMIGFIGARKYRRGALFAGATSA